MHGDEQLFASKYKPYLSTEELREEIEAQKIMFYLQQQEKEDDKVQYVNWVIRIIKRLMVLLHAIALMCDSADFYLELVVIRNL